MNSQIIYEIIDYYQNQKPYYIKDDYICINDDRMCRIVSFKIYENNNEILADFNEANHIFPLNTKYHKTLVIKSLEDFKKKWINYYNFN